MECILGKTLFGEAAAYFISGLGNPKARGDFILFHLLLFPFFPLLAWKGLIGKFMIYLPVMLILTLAASLIVAFIFNPVFAVSFMKPEGKGHEMPAKKVFRQWWFWFFLIMGILFHVFMWHGMGTFFLMIPLMSIMNVFVIRHVIHYFQNKVLPGLMNRYEKMLHWVLKGTRPVWLMVSLFILFPIALFGLMMCGNGVLFFPSGALS